jgi:lysophospholipase L1-like esterase
MNKKTKRIMAVSIIFLVIGLSLFLVFSQTPANKSTGDKLARIACLGDSITQYSGYPNDLKTMLGNDSKVRNFGVSGAAVGLNADRPYYFEPELDAADLFEPTTVIIMLGTNDARQDNYLQIDKFEADYQTIINRIHIINNNAQIFLVKPPPIFNNTLNLNGTNFAEGVIPRIEQVASTLKLPIIDAYTPLLSHSEYFPDGVHPDSEGGQAIANIIYTAINSESK